MLRVCVSTSVERVCWPTRISEGPCQGAVVSRGCVD